MKTKLILTVSLLVCLQSIAWSQARIPELSKFSQWQPKLRLLSRLTDELKITEDQRVSITALQEDCAAYVKVRRAPPLMVERLETPDVTERRKADAEFVQNGEEKLKRILAEDQLRRLEQLELQQDGARALLRPDITQKLNLRVAQRLRILEAQRDSSLKGTDFGVACYQILSEAQRQAWNDLIGEPSAAVIPHSRIAAVAPAGQRVRPPLVELTAAPYIPYSYLRHPSIQADLKLTPDQIAKLSEAGERLDELTKTRGQTADRNLEQARGRSQAGGDYLKTLIDTLTETQKQRIAQIRFQGHGPDAILDRQFRDEAKLTDDQIDGLDQLLRDRTSNPESPVRTTEKSALDNFRARRAYEAETVQLALKQLSDIQRAVWDKMTGEPVAFEALFASPAK
ncbi:MAG: hypothetical protein JSS49_11085 [Planctomycetes bacterium]|nr:hypothetical protein [Planctomycetota bacterium]